MSTLEEIQRNKQKEIFAWIMNNYPSEEITDSTNIEDLRKCVNKLFGQLTDPRDEVSNYEEEEDYENAVYLYSKLLEYKLRLNQK
jgi:E3 ubiquitin-protein ligase DOA10